MIEYIIHHCVRNYEDTTDKKVREQYSIVGGIVGIICNLFLFIGKLLVGLVSNSIAIISDAFNNLSDMGSSFITIISAKLSNRPPDEDHPFGHGRFEYLASLTIAILILIVGFKLCEASVRKFFEPEMLDFSLWGMAILVASIIVKFWMCLYNRYIAKQIHSSVNEATASDSINDAIATTGVLIATLAQQYTTLPIDAAAGTAIGVLIFYSGIKLAKNVVNILLGQAPDPKLVEDITACALRCPYVLGVHDLKIHDYGPGRTYASIHVEVPSTSDIVEVHSAIDELEDQLKRNFQININVHMDPLCMDPVIVNDMRQLLDKMIQNEYPQYHTDNLRFTAGSIHPNIICDLHIPPEEYTEENCIRIRKEIDASMQKYNKRLHVVLARIIPEGSEEKSA